MKPRFIFSAVAAVCILMGAFLPRLAAPSARAAAPALTVPASAVLAATAVPAAAASAELILPTPTAPPQEAAPQPTEALPQDAAAAPAPAAEEDLPVFHPPAAPAAEPAAPARDLPARDAFAASLVNGQPDMVVGFYAADQFALPVLQQPAGDANFISDQDGTVTQFIRPSQYGGIGLLAHNTLSGKLFFHLRMEQEIDLVYGDGRVASFRITDIQSYQALSPYDTHSDFVDLNRPEAPVMNHSELFQRVYTTPGKLVLQTCIEANGEPTWGRIFILADPL